jgi:hypothetical protein
MIEYLLAPEVVVFTLLMILLFIASYIFYESKNTD